MKGIIIGVIVVVIVCVFVGAYMLNGSKISVGEKDTNSSNLESGAEEVITIEQLGTHNTEGDCWIGYNGKVYDVTAFLPKHGGSAQAIIPHCGTEKEFTEAFTKKHGTTKVAILMKVGILIGDFEKKGNLQ